MGCSHERFSDEEIRAHVVTSNICEFAVPKVEEADAEGAKGTLVTEDFGLSQFW